MGVFWVLLAVFHLTVLRCAGNICTVKIESDKDFVLLGETATLNCSSNCKDLVWESRQTKEKTDTKDYFSSVQVRVSDWADSPIKCLAEEESSYGRSEGRVIPYALPSKMTIDLMEGLEEDKEHEVTCSVYDVAPVKYVILSVTRRGEVFLNKTFEEDTRREPQNLTETFKFTTRRSDNMQDFACQVTLNLTRVTNTTVQSSSVLVRTFALPENPHITTEEWVEKGTMTNIQCKVLNGFPTEDNRTQLSVDDKAIGSGNSFLSFSLNTDDLPVGPHKVVCVSEVFSFSKQSEKTIFIYELPAVNLTLSSKVVNFGDTVAVGCSIVGSNVEYFGLRLNMNGVEKMVNSSDLNENITIQHRKPTINATCEVFIQANTKVIHTSDETLTVYYPPEFNAKSCPDSIIWVEGQERMFGCRSEGNPTPEEQCSFNNLSLQSTSYFTAERNMSGVYTCRASNYLGTVTKSVEVTVQYPPEPPTVKSTTSSVNAGGSVNLTCHSDALPPPEYTWTSPTSTGVEFSQDKSFITISKASSEHNGTYICQVKNQHGQFSAKQELEVKSDNSVLWIIIGSLIGAFVLFTVIGLVFYSIWKNGKRGWYDLLKRKPHRETEVPLHENSTV
ncbi:intercellular adhesion molecule 1-like [Pyxicephalus adspersus]|uniref:intercellular adhesion molecule 1-like n=1 Tax=Pyxicephalus adspersus TaxID=30357 RepID=UPI003B5B3E8A